VRVTINTTPDYFRVDHEVLVDCSMLPLERVAQEAPWARLRLPALILLHPDLWHDGRWEVVYKGA